MSRPRTAVYAGSFDPPTNGHLRLIELGMELFDHLIVLVGTNPGKSPWFTPEERVALLKESIAGLPSAPRNVRVDILPAGTYTSVYASKAVARYLLRGLRNGMDFEAEHDMQELNDHIGVRLPIDAPRTVYLALDMHSRVLSSSNVKALVGPEGWEHVIFDLVPPPVRAALQRRFADADRT